MKRKSKLMRREIRTAWLFLLPSLLGISVFVLLPFLDAVRRSFFEAMGEDLSVWGITGQYWGMRPFSLL